MTYQEMWSRQRRAYTSVEVYINAELKAADEARLEIVAEDIRRYLNCCWGVERINVDTDDVEYNEEADTEHKGGIVDGVFRVYFIAYNCDIDFTPFDIIDNVENTIQALNPVRIATEYYKD